MNYTDNEIAQEQWRDIDGYDGAYQVSDIGRVRSLKFGKTRLLRPGKTKDGYFIVQLWRNGQGKMLLVHRIVAEAFIPNDDESKNQVNHKDEVKQNNRVYNLEWCTAQYNLTYNDIHHRHINYKRDKIKELYNPDLTYEQNLKIFKSKGIECSIGTVSNLCRDLGLGKHQSKLKKSDNYTLFFLLICSIYYIEEQCK